MASKQHLVIVESPAKTKKIKSFLGADFEVIASVGHIRDLPEKHLGVDIKKGFIPTYEIYDDKKSVVKNIIDKSKKSDIVYIMTDEDREGEQIAASIVSVLPKGIPYKRAVSSSITKKAITDAIKNAGSVNQDMINSYECRRILDRLCGYKTSYVTKQSTGGASAGRVQSAVLRIIAEREKEIQKFVPQEYWPIDAELLTDRNEKILASVKKPKPLETTNQKQAEDICVTLKKGPVQVSKFNKKTQKNRPYPPFTTSAMLQSAASIFGWKSDKTMRVAQSLYQNSKITYHRTDSVSIVPDFINLTRNHIGTTYGQKYLPAAANKFASKKQAQEAHEACRVTDLAVVKVPDADENKLYELIWKRTVASQMEDMEQLQTSAEFECKEILLGASGSKVIFDGWRKVWNYGSLSASELPVLKVGENVKVIDIKTEQKFTEPPPHYTNNSIIKKLEEKGIGRPSTYATIIKTLEARTYIENKKNISATVLGIKVSDFLVNSDFCFVDIDFTAKLEEQLDEIANHKSDKVDVLKDFWDRLKKDIENAKNIRNKMSQTNFKCPKCKAALLKKNGKFGEFFACSEYSKKADACDYTANVGEDGKPAERVKKQVVESSVLCKNCKNPLLIREGKKGQYLGCRNFAKSEKCRGFFDLDGKRIEFKKKRNYNHGKSK